MHWLLISALTGSALVITPQVANAATHEPDSAHDPSTTYSVNEDDATVHPQPGFEVDTTATPGAGAVNIQGNGVITYDESVNDSSANLETATDINNQGGDGLTVVSKGDISGGNEGSFSITTNGEIRAGGNGIHAKNRGNGDSNITVNGNITGGIGLVDSFYQSAAVQVFSSGSGNTNITTNGKLKGEHSSGIYAYGAEGTTTVNVYNDVSGSDGNGIYLEHEDASTSANFVLNVINDDPTNSTIIVEGNRVGGTGTKGKGIHIQNNALGSDNVITTSKGVTVIGNQGSGISATTYPADSDAETNVTIVSDGDVISHSSYGINVWNQGSGITTIEIGGEITSSGATVSLRADPNAGGGDGDAIITVKEGGFLHNTNSSLTTTRFFDVEGALPTGKNVEIYNSGLIHGVVRGTNEDITFTNESNGVWNTTGGTNNFGGGTNTIINEGTVIARNDNGGPSVTTINGVQNFIDSGDIDMQNDIIGDKLIINGDYYANGAESLLVDVNLETGESDVLQVNNAFIGPDGPNGILVNAIGSGNSTTGDGIEIVKVNGDYEPGAFYLEEPVVSGLYEYVLGDGFEDVPSFFLQSTLRQETATTAVLPVYASRTALSTLSNVHDRQRDVETLSPSDKAKGGVWARAYGQQNNFRTQDANDIGFKSHLWGVQAGIDLKAKQNNAGRREYTGLYVSYASSRGDTTHNNAKIARLDLDATTVGAYYTKYSPTDWYLDLVGQYSHIGSVHSRVNGEDINPSGNSYALSLEVGKKFNSESSIVREVQAQIIDQYTDMKNTRLSDGTEYRLSSMNAVTGRFGVRLYGNAIEGKKFLPWARANIWHTFSGSSSVSSLGSEVNIPIGGSSGELELGFSNGSAQSGGWGFYGSAGYLFDLGGADYKGWKGSLGLRKGW